MFKIALTVIIIGYVIYYAYLIVSDLLFQKEAKTDIAIEEEDIDISDEMSDCNVTVIDRHNNSHCSDATVTPMAEAIIHTGGLDMDDFLADIETYAAGGELSEVSQIYRGWHMEEAA